ncbi:tetratricopeptide repeat protein [Marinospirillum perlucidum]|uniref:tetratricopeptide repeat protein n=1 Tax=Marinospirillum perlucidum TaxID=1982602 RepID=UPI000DF2F284|nr:tetratricopeptide repeat protein [Marinospirillum perlucidum]
MKINRLHITGLVGLLLATSLQASPPELTPRQYEQMTLLGQQLEEGQLNQVIDQGQTYYQQVQGNPAQQAYVKAFVARVVAAAYLEQQQPDAAIPLLHEALDTAELLDNDSLQALQWLLMQVRMDQENYRLALINLERWWAAEEQPSAQAHYLRAALLTELERWQEAEPWIEKALEEATRPQDAWLGLAVYIFQQQEDWSQAARYQQQRVDAFPEKQRLWPNLAQLQRLAGDEEAALVTLELAQRQGYLNRNQQEYLGRALLTSSQPLRAAQVFEKLLESLPQAAAQEETLLRLAAQAWLQTSQPDKTIAALRRLAEQTGSLRDRQRLADWYYSQGQWQEAAEIWQQLLPEQEGEEASETRLSLARSQIELQDYSTARSLLEDLLETSKAEQARQWLNYLDAL